LIFFIFFFSGFSGFSCFFHCGLLRLLLRLLVVVVSGCQAA
jgi:hypothetical protein